MLGYPDHEPVGQPAEVLVPLRFRERHMDVRRKFIASPQTCPMGEGRDLFGLRKDGSEFVVEIGLNSTTTSSGYLVVASIADITQRKRASESATLRERAREKVELYQQLGLAAAVLESDGRVHFLNPLFRTLQPLFVFKGKRMEIADRVAQEFLKRELARLELVSDEKVVPAAQVIGADGSAPVILLLLPVKTSYSRRLGILIVTKVGAAGLPSATTLQTLFALAPAEARVAALIGSGRSPGQAAEKLGISEGNVRKLKARVFLSRRIAAKRIGDAAEQAYRPINSTKVF